MSQHEDERGTDSRRDNVDQVGGWPEESGWGDRSGWSPVDDHQERHPDVIIARGMRARERTFVANADHGQAAVSSTSRGNRPTGNNYASTPPIPRPPINVVPIPSNDPHSHRTSTPIPAPILLNPGAYHSGRVSPVIPLPGQYPYTRHNNYIEVPSAPPRPPSGHTPFVPQRVAFASNPEPVVYPPAPIIPDFGYPSPRFDGHGRSAFYPPSRSPSPGISDSYLNTQPPYPHTTRMHTPYASHQTPIVVPDGNGPGRRTSTDSFRTMRTLSHNENMQESTYVAVDPFRPSQTATGPEVSLPFTQEYDDWGNPLVSTPPHVVYPYSRRRAVAMALLVDSVTISTTFLFNTLPRQLYLHFLLRLPSLYWSRVARIFEEAELAVPEIKKIAVSNVRRGMNPMAMQSVWVNPARGGDLKTSWDAFIDSLVREWKTLNIVSVLLLSAILTILQIESAAADPITRNAAIFSLLCALMSLLYGCIYIIRFSSMKRIYKAAEWAQEAQKTKTFIWWNVWVLLAMPAAWLAWSLILYITCIMAFVWRTGTTGQDSVLVLTPYAERAIRISISAVLGLGVLYFVLIMNTLRRYGDAMDRSFKARVERWVKEKELEREKWTPHPGAYPMFQPTNYFESHLPQPRPMSPQSEVESQYNRRDSTPAYPYPPNFHPMPLYTTSEAPFKAVKIMDLSFQSENSFPMPDFLVKRDFSIGKWEKFISEQSYIWKGPIPLHQRKPINKLWPYPIRPQDSIAASVEEWNLRYFERRGTNVLLCREYSTLFPDSPSFALYLIDFQPSTDGWPFPIKDRFGQVPEGLERIDIFCQYKSDRSTPRTPGIISIFPDEDLIAPTTPDPLPPARLSTISEVTEQPSRIGSYDVWTRWEPDQVPLSPPVSPITNRRPDSLSSKRKAGDSGKGKRRASSASSSSDSFQSLPPDRSRSPSPHTESIPQRQTHPNEQTKQPADEISLRQIRTKDIISPVPEPASNGQAFQPSDTGRGRDQKRGSQTGWLPSEMRNTSPLARDTEGSVHVSSQSPAMTSDSGVFEFQGPWTRDHLSLQTLLVPDVSQGASG
ncbi:hypothetical protein Hypma_005923 [Hypsizygus marmoreus]|uniref:Uncharacterized protein n=1 Tax=Hypsizygus marmoreus TaxID=39966 RepID=A0A369K7J6_HYPMA|nr:hypothetical protein Hypma_005923 [Hypsizygus marmoreus]